MLQYENTIMNINKKDIIWNYLGIFCRLGINIIIMPLILAFLTEDEIGLWYVFSSVGNIAVLFDFGFAATLARNVAYCWSGAERLVAENVVFANSNRHPNIILMKKVMLTCRMIYLVISTLAMIVLLFVGTPYIYYITKNQLNYQYILAWLVYSLGVFLNLYYGYFTSFLKGVGAVAENNKAIVLSKLVQIISSVVLLANGGGLLAVSTAFLLSGIILRIASKRMFLRYEDIGNQLKTVKETIKTNEIIENFKIIWHNAWRDGLVSLSNYMMTQVTTLICSLRLSLEVTGQYGLCLQIVTLLANISMSLYGTYQPVLQQCYLQKNEEKSKRILSLVILVYWFLYLSGFAAILVLGIPIIYRIKPGYDINSWMLCAMAAYTLLYNNHSLFTSYISNTNRVPYVKAYCISAIFTVVTSTFFLYFTSLGIWGLILAEIAVNLFYNNWKWPHKVLKELHISYYMFFKMGINETKKFIGEMVRRK